MRYVTEVGSSAQNMGLVSSATADAPTHHGHALIHCTSKEWRADLPVSRHECQCVHEVDKVWWLSYLGFYILHKTPNMLLVQS